MEFEMLFFNFFIKSKKKKHTQKNDGTQNNSKPIKTHQNWWVL